MSRLIYVMWILLIFAASATQARATAPRPNIILCMADDQGWSEVGYNGHSKQKTPVLDEMARTGFRFDRFYAAPNCGPTRGSIMTGRNSIRFGQFGPTWSMRPEEITIAEILKLHGYATAHYGKWHLGPVKSGAPNNPGSQGFDEWLSHDNFFEINPPLSRNGAAPEIHQGESSEIIVREAISFIEQAVNRKQPFFTVIWFGSCHGPHIALDKDRQLYDQIDHENAEKLAHRYGEITAMDRAVGELRSALRKQDAAENTILWYCSDNGEPSNSWYKPMLNGSKGNLFEGGIRVPAIIEWPGGISQPATTSVNSVTSDILPTICDWLDISWPDRILDGVSLVPLIQGRTKERAAPICFWRYGGTDEESNKPWMTPDSQLGTTPTASNPATQFKNYRHPVEKSEFGGDAAIIDGHYKLIVDTTGRHRKKDDVLTPLDGDVALFDLVADRKETTNIATTHPQRVASMMKQLRLWQASVEHSLTGAEY